MLEYILIVVAQSLWLMLPTYISNSSAVLVGSGKPVDFNMNFIDGKRIFGNGKTWLGLVGGIVIGMGAGSAQSIAISVSTLYEKETFLPNFGFGWNFPLVLFCMCFGAMCGDLCKSFIKRRLLIEQGGKLPVLDQLDFVFGSWLFLLLFVPNWFLGNFKLEHIIFILLVTPLLHRVINIIGYKLGKKSVPW